MIVTRAGSGEPYLATVAAKSVCTGVLVHILGTLDNLSYDPFGSPHRGQKPFSERKDVTALLGAVYAPPVPPLREGPYPIPKP